MSTSAPADSADVAAYALRLGDDALISAQRMGGWITHAPTLEEEVALGNIGLDQLGQARALLSYAGELTGRSEDDFAYLRDERAFTHVQLVELPNGDFAFTMGRLLCFAAYQQQLYARLTSSTDPTLAGIAVSAAKEVAYHVSYATDWVLRLGDGTAESHDRMQTALDAVWPYTGELFEADELVDRLVTAGVAVTLDRGDWLRAVDGIVERATCTTPADGFTHTGGRRGIHTEHAGRLLAEMQYLTRTHPGATW